jgi:hypothetical protein
MATKTSFARWIAGTTLSAVGLWSASAVAAAPPPPVPATLTQQGRILNADGTTVSSTVAITFTLYNDAKASAAANVLWTDTVNLTLDDGYFSTQLGATAKDPLPPAAFDGSVLYLGVTVGSDDEMTPRQAVTSVPYAFVAGSAAVAVSAPFTGLTGIPALCAAGQYLKGYNADGTAACGTLPSLTCTVRYTGYVASVTSEAVACAAGEVMTGGGCDTSGYLSGSFQDVCIVAANQVTDSPVTPAATPVGPILPPIIINPCLFATGKWTCNTVASASIRAYAHCCTVQ